MRLTITLPIIALSCLAKLAVADFHVFGCLTQNANGQIISSLNAVSSHQFECNPSNFAPVVSSAPDASGATSWTIQSICGLQVFGAQNITSGGYNLSGADGTNYGYCDLQVPQGSLVGGCTSGMSCVDSWVCYSLQVCPS